MTVLSVVREVLPVQSVVRVLSMTGDWIVAGLDMHEGIDIWHTKVDGDAISISLSLTSDILRVFSRCL